MEPVIPISRDGYLSAEDIVVGIATGAKGPYDLDPIRVMKSCFLVSQRGREQWKAAFRFEPYDYGPFDRGVYGAVEALVARGLLDADHSARYPTYRLTDSGRQRAREIREAIGEQAASWLEQVGRYVTSRSFSQLLEEIYAAFPAFAMRSVVH
jgi:hypothetical protein